MVGGSKTVLDMGTEYRSLAFSMGGQGDWRTVTSLPNILKLFNPTLRGASMSNTVVASRQTSGYNMAVSAGDSLDMVEQAWHLVKRMRRDPKMDFNRDWKMVTVFVGANDIGRNLCNNTLGFLPRCRNLSSRREASSYNAGRCIGMPVPSSTGRMSRDPWIYFTLTSPGTGPYCTTV